MNGRISDFVSSWPHSGGGSRASAVSLQDWGLSAAAWCAEWLGPGESCVSVQNELPSRKHRPPQGVSWELQSLLIWPEEMGLQMT